MKVFLFIVLIALIGISDQVEGQTFKQDISQIKYLHDELRFEEAVDKGQLLLEDAKNLSVNQLKYIHQYMAFSYFNIGLPDSSRIHFLSLLSIDPGIELNSLETSPKIIDSVVN